MRTNVPLAKYTTFRIGGPATYFFEPRTAEELRETCRRVTRRRDRPVYILGGGSNLLVADDGVDGPVICMRRFERRYLRRFGNLVRVSAGVPLRRLLAAAADWGLAGLEDAGTPRVSFGDLVSFLEVMDAGGRLERLPGEAVRWRYRSADLGGRVAAFVELQLRTDRPDAVKARLAEAFERKRAAQPLTLPSAGCFFKNPKSAAAGRLLERAGLKGLGSGGAAVSRKHANFIVNRGGATAADVLTLVRIIRRAVRDLFNVDLEPEVCVWP